MKEALFNFEPVHSNSRKAQGAEYVNVNTHTSMLTFSKGYIVNNRLEGQYIKFFVDVSKHAIGWKVLTRAASLEGLIKDHRQIKRNKAGVFSLCATSIINQLKPAPTATTFTRLKVKEYNCNYSGTYQGIISYVILKNNNVTST